MYDTIKDTNVHCNDLSISLPWVGGSRRLFWIKNRGRTRKPNVYTLNEIQFCLYNGFRDPSLLWYNTKEKNDLDGLLSFQVKDDNFEITFLI